MSVMMISQPSDTISTKPYCFTESQMIEIHMVVQQERELKKLLNETNRDFALLEDIVEEKDIFIKDLEDGLQLVEKEYDLYQNYHKSMMELKDNQIEEGKYVLEETNKYYKGEVKKAKVNSGLKGFAIGVGAAIIGGILIF